MVSPADRSAARSAGFGFVALVAATFALIVLGALVRAHGAGLSCPDWPLCFGALIPQFDFRVALEWGHRLLAGAVALGFAGFSVVALRRRALRTRTVALIVAAALLLAVQIGLGGLTVLLGLAPWTVTAHLLAGNAFCALLLWISRNLFDVASEVPVSREHGPPGTAVTFGIAGTASLLVLQLALGGWVSSHYAGLACPAFPTCDGASFAPAFGGLVGIHVLHRLNGYALALAFVALAWATRGRGLLGRLAWSGARLVLLQVAIGVANVLFLLPVELTALHSAVAAGLVLVTTLLVREGVAARTRSADGGTAADESEAVDAPQHALEVG